MKLSPQGLELIKSFEGLYLKSYRCPAGVLTIGYGHTSAAGRPKVTEGMGITKAEAEAILIRDLGQYEEAVQKAVKVPLTDNQYAALVSFCFNVGPSAFLGSSVLKEVNAKRFDLVPSRLALWNKGGGKVLPGLVRRRAAEGDLFMEDMKDEVVHFSDKIEPSPGKPASKSTTNIAASAVGAAGIVSTAAEVSRNVNTIQTNLSSTNVLILVLGAVIVIGAAYIIYDRIQKSKKDGV